MTRRRCWREEILRNVKGAIPVGDQRVEPSVSIGIAIGDRRTDPERLVRDASVAMGQAKADGRDRYSFADASMADQARRRLDVERRLREGLAEDRFLPYFQPVVDLDTGQITGYEALVRYRRVDGTIAPPARFMPIAELSPLICDIDMTMLRARPGDAGHAARRREHRGEPLDRHPHPPGLPPAHRAADPRGRDPTVAPAPGGDRDGPARGDRPGGGGHGQGRRPRRAAGTSTTSAPATPPSATCATCPSPG